MSRLNYYYKLLMKEEGGKKVPQSGNNSFQCHSFLAPIFSIFTLVFVSLVQCGNSLKKEREWRFILSKCRCWKDKGNSVYKGEGKTFPSENDASSDSEIPLCPAHTWKIWAFAYTEWESSSLLPLIAYQILILGSKPSYSKP